MPGHVRLSLPSWQSAERNAIHHGPPKFNVAPAYPLQHEHPQLVLWRIWDTKGMALPCTHQDVALSCAPIQRTCLGLNSTRNFYSTSSSVIILATIDPQAQGARPIRLDRHPNIRGCHIWHLAADTPLWAKEIEVTPITGMPQIPDIWVFEKVSRENRRVTVGDKNPLQLRAPPLLHI